MKTKSLSALLLLLPILAIGAPPASPRGEFTALATMETKQGTRSMGFTLIVSNPMTRDEARPLKEVLAQSGQQGLLNAIRGSSRGRLSLGGIEYPVDVVVAEETSDGLRLLVVTARPLKIEEVNEGRASLESPFTCFDLTVPGFGTGEGTIYTQASLSLDADDRLKIEQYEGRPGTLRDVKRVR